MHFRIETAVKLYKIRLLSCGSLTDRDLKPLRHLAELKSLTLKGAFNVTDKTLLYTQDLSRLSSLSLAGATSLKRAPLERFQSLISLDLSNCLSLTAVSFPDNLPLRVLDLQGCVHLRDKSLAGIHELTVLEQINLSGTGITDDTIWQLPAGSMQVRFASPDV